MPNQDARGAWRPPNDTVNVGEVAERLAISRSLAYKLAREDRLPVPVIRLGRRVVVPRRALDRLLSNDDAAVRPDHWRPPAAVAARPPVRDSD